MAETIDIEELMKEVRAVVEEDASAQQSVIFIDEVVKNTENPHALTGGEEAEAGVRDANKRATVPRGPLSLLIDKLTGRRTNLALAPSSAQANNFNLKLIKIINEQDLKIKSLARGLSGIEERIDKSLTNFNYIGFEDEFRGPEAEIKKRQARLVGFFSGKSNVLDIGCGRGEFLELLQENQVGAQGIDADADMVGRCQSKGLKVIKGDALSYLAEQKDDCLDGIFMGQVVEHLAPRKLVQLIEAAYLKLKTDGYLVMETINPLCLSVFADSFFLDITHKQPVHPQFLKFLLRSLGFKDIELIFMSPTEEKSKLKKLDNKNKSRIEEINLINDNLEKLNDLLFSYRDYAIAAKK